MNQQAPPRTRRRWLRALLATLVGVVLVVLGHPWWLPTALEVAGPRLARSLVGFELEIDAVQRADFGGVEVEGLRLRPIEEGAALQHLYARHLAATFDLRRLVSGDLAGITDLDAEGLRIEVETDGSGDEGADESPAEPIALPARLPSIQLTDVEFELRQAGRPQVVVSAGSLQVDEEQGLHLIAEVLIEEGRERRLELASVWKDRGLEGLRIEVDERTILTGSRVDLAGVGRGELEARLSLALGGGSIGIELGGDGIHWDASLDGLDLGTVESLSPVDLGLGLKGVLRATSSGELAWRAPLESEAMLAFELTDLEVLDWAVPSARGELAVGNQRLRIDALHVEQSSNHVSLQRSDAPLVAASWREWLTLARGDLELELHDLEELLGAFGVFPSDASALPEHSLVASATLAEGVLQLASGELQSSGGGVVFSNGALSVPVDQGAAPTLALAGRAAIDDLGELGRIFGREDWKGALRGNLDIDGAWPQLEGHALLEGASLRIEGIDFGTVSVDAEADSRGIEVRQLRAAGESIELVASCGWVYASRSLRESHLRLALPRLEDWLPADDVKGNLVLELQAQGPIDALESRGRVDLDSLSIGAVEVSAAALRFRGAGRKLRIEGLHSESVFGHLDAELAVAFAAELWPLAIDLESLSLEREGIGLSLAEPTHIEWGSTAGRLENLRLAGQAGELDLSAEWSQGELELAVDARGLQPDVFLAGTPAEIPKLERADLSLRVQLSDENLRLESQGSLAGLSLIEWPEPIDLAWDLIHAEELLDLRRLEARGGDELSIDASGNLPLSLFPTPQLSEGALDLSLTAQLPLEPLPGPELTGQFDGTATLAGSWSALTGGLRLQASELHLPNESYPDDLGRGEVSGELILDDGITAKGLTLRFGSLIDTHLDAHLETDLDLPRWIAEPDRMLEESRIAAEFELGALDIEELEPLLATLGESAERLRKGRVSGTFRVEGALLDAQLFGALKLEELRLRLGSGLPSLDRLNADITLAGERLEIRSLTAELGAAPLELSGDVDFGAPSPEVALHVAGNDLLLYRSREGKVRANTDITIEGPLEALLVSGKIELTDGRYAPGTNFMNLRRGPSVSGGRGFQLFALRETPLREMSFDVELTSLEPFELRNSVMQGSMRPRLHLGGTGLVPVLGGTVYLDQLLLSLPASRLELRGGTVAFREDDPFVPVVEIVGQTRSLGYDVRANISGPYDAPEIHLSSTPPVTQEELLLLLMTGQPPKSSDADALSTANTVALYLAKDTLASWFGDDGLVNLDSAIERFEFAFGRDISKQGTETIDMAFRLTDKMDKAPEERERRHLYLTAERDKYEDYNYGFRIVFRIRR